MEPEDVEEDADEAPAPPAPPPAPPRPEIKIVDAATRRRASACVVCRRPKPTYIEVEIDGTVEYTCRECYDLQSQGLSGEVSQYCVKCGTAILRSDHFCGKCGTPAVLACPSCGARADEEDAFCGKCGSTLRAPP